MSRTLQRAPSATCVIGSPAIAIDKIGPASGDRRRHASVQLVRHQPGRPSVPRRIRRKSWIPTVTTRLRSSRRPTHRRRRPPRRSTRATSGRTRARRRRRAGGLRAVRRAQRRNRHRHDARARERQQQYRSPMLLCPPKPPEPSPGHPTRRRSRFRSRLRLRRRCPPGPPLPDADDAAAAGAVFRQVSSGCIRGRATSNQPGGHTSLSRQRPRKRPIVRALTVRTLQRRLTPRVTLRPGRYRVRVRVTFQRGTGSPAVRLPGDDSDLQRGARRPTAVHRLAQRVRVAP